MKLIRIFSLFLLAIFVAGCATTPTSTGDPVRDSLAYLETQQAGFRLQFSEPASYAVKEGDLLDLHFASSRSGYVSLYVVHSSRKISRLIANFPVTTHVTYRFPSAESANNLQFSKPYGMEYFVLAATALPVEPLTPAEIETTGASVILNVIPEQFGQWLSNRLNLSATDQWEGAVLQLEIIP
ncbi:MAG: hypothetical protein ACI909_003554 [Planctomycetota bacterium]|jgi:hypothetical protein